MSPKSGDGTGKARLCSRASMAKGLDEYVQVGVIPRLPFPGPFCTKTVNMTGLFRLYRVRKTLPSTRAVTSYLGKCTVLVLDCVAGWLII